MIKLNRTTEYGLMALRHMSRKRQAASAREIADSYGLPFEITAKTLQRLKDTGLIQSAQGARGGYTLQRPLEDVNLAEFLQLMEGPQAVVACATAGEGTNPGLSGIRELKVAEETNCAYRTRCEIKSVMSDLNSRVYRFLSGIRLAELASVDESSRVELHSITKAIGEEP